MEDQSDQWENSWRMIYQYVFFYVNLLADVTIFEGKECGNTLFFWGSCFQHKRMGYAPLKPCSKITQLLKTQIKSHEHKFYKVYKLNWYIYEAFLKPCSKTLKPQSFLFRTGRPYSWSLKMQNQGWGMVGDSQWLMPGWTVPPPFL